MKTYSELNKKDSLKDRFNYLKLDGKVSEETFGGSRWLNQVFYKSKEWKHFRNGIILRDNGCELGCADYPIVGPVYIHHINPISISDIKNRNLDVLLNPENAICVSFEMHNAIHYGDDSIFLNKEIADRSPGDQTPWRTI